MVATDVVHHLTNSRAPALGIIGRQRLARKALAPQLAGDDVHVALNPSCLRLGLVDDFLGGETRVQLQLQLAIEPVLAEPPIPLGSRQ